MKKTIFWQVDCQNDFMKEGGRLYVQKAEGIIPNLQLLARFARSRPYIQQSGSVDAHEPDDPEFDLYGPHCVKGTPGQLIIDEIRPDLAMKFVRSQAHEPRDLCRILGFKGAIYFEKQATDVFTNANVNPYLLTPDLGLVVVYGVVDHICVEEAVLGMRKNFDFDVAVVSDATKELEPEKREAAFAKFKEKGAKIVTTDEIIKYLKGV
ncbi:isochorismatase family protein [Candidatus Woesearchaeota archaeon]|nr:isochorismatase family protein [Candidatus Woesearchaeota archaeon]